MMKGGDEESSVLLGGWLDRSYCTIVSKSDRSGVVHFRLSCCLSVFCDLLATRSKDSFESRRELGKEKEDPKAHYYNKEGILSNYNKRTYVIRKIILALQVVLPNLGLFLRSSSSDLLLLLAVSNRLFL